MKKHIILMSFVTLISCGKIKTSDQFNIVRKFEPIAISDSDKSSITSLCNVLAQKTIALDSTLGASYTFSLATKDCDDKNIGSTNVVAVNSQKDGNNYFFKAGTVPFRFQYIETNSSGSFKEICSNVNGLTNPYKDANGNATWFSIIPGNEDCPPIKGNTCVLFETGFPKAGSLTSYTITVRDWMSIIVDPNFANRGFYTYRKQKNKSSCSEDKFQEAIAILK